MMRIRGLALLVSLATAAGAHPAPTELEALAYEVDFFPGTTYDESIPTPEECLGFRPGERAAFPHEIERCLEAWDQASPRTRLFEYARSHEGRALYYIAMTSAANQARLDEIKANLGRLADPRGLSDAEAAQLASSTPAPAWLAYSIHGDETSGADGAVTVIYHLAAATDAGVPELLDELVVLIDPMMNPDGRHRYLQMVAEHRATAPNVDDQSLLHSGYWPWGRTNHYGFDLNRDWIWGVTPEGRGRIQASGAWHPLVFVDAHEMGSQDTYLFSPERKPRNPHFPERRGYWAGVFARDQSEAFDRSRWLYYTGEWNEGWYPGYSDAWGTLRGAVGILYEQARFTEDGVRRPEGTIHTYREAVHHQAVSSLANLTTLARNAVQLKTEFVAERRRAVSADGPYARRTFAVLPTENSSRLRRFLDLMELQTFEVYVAKEEFTAAGRDQLGRDFHNRRLPAGTILIPNRQPEAHLLTTMLEFDARMPEDYLRRERQSILREGSSTIYDVTAWNTTMYHGLEALTLERGLPAGAVLLESAPPAPSAEETSGETVGWVVAGADDDSVAFAARLMERDVQVRVARKPFELSGRCFPRGSVVVTPQDNRRFEGDLVAVLETTAGELGLELRTLTTGLGDGDLPDLGGRHFRLLERPRIALLSRGGVSVYDYGSIWYALDYRLGIRHSQLDQQFFSFADLRRYNVIVLPDRWFGTLPEDSVEALKTWVEAGGTLIAIGKSAGQLAKEEPGLSQVRQLPDVLDKLDGYELAVAREWLAVQGELPETADVWSHTAGAAVDYPWDAEFERPGKEELERRDRWNRMFVPQGTITAGRVDEEHWLTLGAGDVLPILYLSSRVLMSDSSVETPVRIGALVESGDARPIRVGWARVPAGHELRVRMSGLLWPEAVERLANAAWVTRESKGKGQVILFADSATFRASTLATERVLLNAMIYGPGFGASHPIQP